MLLDGFRVRLIRTRASSEELTHLTLPTQRCRDARTPTTARAASALAVSLASDGGDKCRPQATHKGPGSIRRARALARVIRGSDEICRSPMLWASAGWILGATPCTVALTDPVCIVVCESCRFDSWNILYNHIYQYEPNVSDTLRSLGAPSASRQAARAATVHIAQAERAGGVARSSASTHVLAADGNDQHRESTHSYVEADRHKGDRLAYMHLEIVYRDA